MYKYLRIDFDENNPDDALEQLAKVKEIKASFDYTVIDLAGNANKLLKLALAMADVAVFPFDPSGKALNTIPKIIKIINSVKATVNNSLKTCSVLSIGYARAFANVQAINTLKSESYQKALPYLDAVTRRRVDITYADNKGLAVSEYKGASGKAVNETKAFCKKIQTLCE